DDARASESLLQGDPRRERVPRTGRGHLVRTMSARARDRGRRLEPTGASRRRLARFPALRLRPAKGRVDARAALAAGQPRRALGLDRDARRDSGRLPDVRADRGTVRAALRPRWLAEPRDPRHARRPRGELARATRTRAAALTAMPGA